MMPEPASRLLDAWRTTMEPQTADVCTAFGAIDAAEDDVLRSCTGGLCVAGLRLLIALDRIVDVAELARDRLAQKPADPVSAAIVSTEIAMRNALGAIRDVVGGGVIPGYGVPYGRPDQVRNGGAPAARHSTGG